MVDTPEKVLADMRLYQTYEKLADYEGETITGAERYLSAGSQAFYKKYHYFGREIEEYLVLYIIFEPGWGYYKVDYIGQPAEEFDYWPGAMDFDGNPNCYTNWIVINMAETFVFVDSELIEDRKSTFSGLKEQVEVECGQGMWQV